MAKKTVKSRKKNKPNRISFSLVCTDTDEAERLTKEFQKTVRKWRHLLEHDVQYEFEITYED